MPFPTTPQAPWEHGLCLFCLLNIHPTPRTAPVNSRHAMSIRGVNEFSLEIDLKINNLSYHFRKEEKKGNLHLKQIEGKKQQEKSAMRLKTEKQ